MIRVRQDLAPARHKPLGPWPIVSCQHSYDTRPAETFWYKGRWMTWLDVWRLRGGSVMRDTAIHRRATDMADLRNFDERLTWGRLLQELNARRSRIRRGELANLVRDYRHGLRVVK